MIRYSSILQLSTQQSCNKQINITVLISVYNVRLLRQYIIIDGQNLDSILTFNFLTSEL
jgi:hypothetical protein